MKCPKCGYERRADDQCPEYECPSCGVNYAKFKMAQEGVRLKGKLKSVPSLMPVKDTRNQKKSADDWQEVMMFRVMMTPELIRWGWWISLVIGLGVAIYGLAHDETAKSIVAIMTWPFLTRIVAEMLILPFRIHEALEEIRQKLND